MSPLNWIPLKGGGHAELRNLPGGGNSHRPCREPRHSVYGEVEDGAPKWCYFIWSIKECLHSLNSPLHHFSRFQGRIQQGLRKQEHV